MCQRISYRNTHFIFAKLLRFQRAFLEKSFVSGFGADAPTFNAHAKKHGVAVLFIFDHYMLELREGPSFSYFSYKKSKQNFPTTTPLYFGEAFEVPRNFSRKVSCVRVWGRRPNIQRPHKKHGNAVLFSYFSVYILFFTNSRQKHITESIVSLRREVVFCVL